MGRCSREVLRGTLFLVALLGVPSCRGPAPAPPPAGEAAAPPGTCPIPLVRGQTDRTVPARLQLTNRTPERLVVFVDGCRTHFRWGTLEPGGTAVLRLPSRLYPYRGGMRLHAYASYPRERYGTYIAPLEDGPVLRFTMTPAGVAALMEPGTPVDQDRTPGQGGLADEGEGGAAVQVHRSDSGLAYMTVWSEDRRITLTWLCGEGGLTVHLAGPGLDEVDAPPSVSVRATGGGDGPVDETWGAGEWELEKNPSPALHGAADAASRMLGLGGAHAVLDVEARFGAERAGPWRIPVGDLAIAAQDLTCR